MVIQDQLVQDSYIYDLRLISSSDVAAPLYASGSSIAIDSTAMPLILYVNATNKRIPPKGTYLSGLYDMSYTCEDLLKLSNRADHGYRPTAHTGWDDDIIYDHCPYVLLVYLLLHMSHLHILSICPPPTSMLCRSRSYQVYYSLCYPSMIPMIMYDPYRSSTKEGYIEY